MGLTDRRRGAERKTVTMGEYRIGYFNRTPYYIRYRYRINLERFGMDLRHGALANGAFVMAIQNNAMRIMRCAVVDGRWCLSYLVMMLMEDLFAE